MAIRVPGLAVAAVALLGGTTPEVAGAGTLHGGALVPGSDAAPPPTLAAPSLRGTALSPTTDTILKRNLAAPTPLGVRPTSSSSRLQLGLGPAPPLDFRPRVQAPGTLEQVAPWLAARVRSPRLFDPLAPLAPPTPVDAGGRISPPGRFERLATREFVLETAARGGRPLPPGLSERAAAARTEPSFSLDDPFQNLTMEVSTRAELGGDWTRFRPCTSQFQDACQPNLFPQLSPDLNFAVRIGGTFLDRLTVDVDYDQLREFGQTNRLSMVYRGGPDAVLERFEVGDVDFRLPQSRFLTRGIPSGNFGFQMEGQLGPLDFRSVWAEQRGDLTSREFRLAGVGNQRRFVQEDTLVVDDADYQRGQFFFLVDPILLDRYPHIDVLDLDAGAAPADVIPGFDPIQLYRFENDPAARQQVEGYIQADAVLGARGDTIRESGWFRALIPGQEYFVHPSGLWVALRNPLSRDEMLAVTYITAAGDTIGDYNPEAVYSQGGRPQLKLLKATAANHQPGRPTWEIEMHQVYRVSASPDVEPASVDPVISLGELSAGRTFERAPDGQDVTYLQLFGLDQESPVDRVDPAFVYTPGAELFQDPPAVSGTFLIFPTLRPFLEPPPNPGIGLDEMETEALLGGDANRRIYESEDPFERDNGGLFRITLPYRVRSEGVISTFALGAIGVRQGSERILFDDRELVRGIDYEISYDVGLVTLLEPEALFATNPDAPIRASWEQQQLFRNAPTSVLGFVGHLGTPERGELDLLALYQSEKTLVNRPVLGLEPGAITLGGLGGRIARSAPFLDRLLAALPGVRMGEGSSFQVEGELALSLPTPNTQGDVFLDDFDASDARPLSLLSTEWTRGSAPAQNTGIESLLPVPSPESKADLAWQHRWIIESLQGDSVGIQEGFLPREEIDQQIRVAGSRVREPGLRLTLDGGSPGAPQWSSITTTLAPNGTDLTRSEFLEFYVADGQRATLVVDLGTVSEDAFFVDDQGNTSGIKANGIPWGLGRLDQEADPALGQIWGDELDQFGVWGESCQADPGRIYRLGDERANCTRGNGRNDSEDLDGDGNLDTAERTLRFVLQLDGSSPFLARDRGETGTGFRLYRIPIRSPGAIEVNGPVTESDLRAVRHIRFTMIADRPEDLTLARLSIIGSRWIKRVQDGILTGIIGDTVSVGGRVEVGPVSRITEGDSYASPPGVLEQLADPTSAVGGQGIEFNERALALSVDALMPGDRAEIYTRYPQRPRNFLNYREARLWVVPREGGWSPTRDVSFFTKIGSDPENFYLFRSPLREPASSGVTPPDWLPEVVIDFDRLIDLRRRAEELLILNPIGPGDPPLEVWSADSTYAVVLRDRGRAPDLANVREISFGIWNRDSAPFAGEVWINELRLGRGVQDAGFAGTMQATLTAGDLMETRFSLTQRGANFRQLDERQTFQTDRALSFSSRVRLERLVPSGWGVELPLSVSYGSRDLDPTFLNNSDVRADRIVRLRETGSGQSRISLGVRKTSPTEGTLSSVLFDGLDANVAVYQSDASSITSTVDTRGFDARVGYDKRLAPREFDPLPGPLEGVVRALLPEPLEGAVLDARIRWAPERLQLGAAYGRQDNAIRRFEAIIQTPQDSLVEATQAPRKEIEAVAAIGFRPLPSLTADATLVSIRDLLRPDEVVNDPEVQALLRGARSDLIGLDVGWETDRRLTTRYAWRPRVLSWLTPDVTVTSQYRGERNPSFTGFQLESATDSSRILERNVRGERDLQGRIVVSPEQLVQALGGEGATQGGLGAWIARLRPVNFTWQDGIFSRFNREAVDPGTAFQLGWASLDGFRVLGADTAATLVDREATTWGWGIAEGSASLDFGYQQSVSATLDRRADRTVRRRVWPDVRASLNDLVLPEGWRDVLARVALSSSIRRAQTETVLGQVAQTRTTDEWNVPWDVTLTWVGSLVTSYRGSMLDAEGVDPTGNTDRDRVSHRISVTSLFPLPSIFAARIPEPVRLAVIATYVDETECRVSRSRNPADCVAFVDQLNRGLSFTLDTSIEGFEVGLQASYTDRQSSIGQRTGSTQFQLGLFGQFLFRAGDQSGFGDQP